MTIDNDTNDTIYVDLDNTTMYKDNNTFKFNKLNVIGIDTNNVMIIMMLLMIQTI